MGFVRRTITKMAEKWCSQPWSLLTFKSDSSKFHIWIASIKVSKEAKILSLKFKFHIWISFIKLAQVQIWALFANHVGCLLVFLHLWTLLTSFKFHIRLLSSNYCSCLNMGFCPMNDNKNGRQNGYPLFTAGHYAGAFV